MSSEDIRLVVADVDGTLVTQAKILTDRSIAAVRQLREHNILFAVTSGRPPRGMGMLIEPLGLTTTIAGFNGGLVVNADMSVVTERTVASDLVPGVVDLLVSFSLTVWVYQGTNWIVPDRNGPHVDREASTVQFEPIVRTDIRTIIDDVVKIVGVSDDHEAVEAAVSAVRENFGNHVTAARSQPYYIDVTNPDANKGEVVQDLSARYAIPREKIATLGDMPNDVLMFAHSGMSIAMGNADSEVQRAAKHVTTSNEEEGFAKAVERIILKHP
jgi:Cof subfamily protein (haloacid dehalogenase superfamily)